MAEDLQHDTIAPPPRRAGGQGGSAARSAQAGPPAISTVPAPVIEPQVFSLEVMLEKYAKGDETRVEEIYQRVARGVALAEPEARRADIEAEFTRNFERGALGAGRIMSAAGAGIEATLINCFVQPVGDSIQGVDENGLPGL